MAYVRLHDDDVVDFGRGRVQHWAPEFASESHVFVMLNKYCLNAMLFVLVRLFGYRIINCIKLRQTANESLATSYVGCVAHAQW